MGTSPLTTWVTKTSGGGGASVWTVFFSQPERLKTTAILNAFAKHDLGVIVSKGGYMGAGLATSIGREHPDFSAQPILAITAHALQLTNSIRCFYGTLVT